MRTAMDRMTLEIQLLGGFAVRVGTTTVPDTVWRQRRAAAIVKLLALEPGHRLHREQLLETLWPELDPERAANNLRVALHHARRGLEAAGAAPNRFLVRDGDGVLLGPPRSVTVDVARFTQAVAQAWQRADPNLAAAAAARYTGDLLPEDPYEEWAAARRETLRASYVALLARLAGLYEARGELPRAVATRRRVLAVEPLDEPSHAALMRLHSRLGDPAQALAHYAHFAAQLERALGTEPERETRELAAAIRDGHLLPDAVPAPPDVGVAPLPVAVDALVGRTRELAELARLVGTARLVTLTGPAGIGKTRLALELARAVAERFPDGASFVDLAAVRDPALVLPTVARALGVEETGEQPVARLLAAAIRSRRILLVLDNLEQVAAAAPDIAEVLTACPRLVVLGTSRVRLRLRGEQEYPVAPLPLPPQVQDGRAPRLDELEGIPAIVLFTRRARAARPSFTLTAENVGAVAAICRRLDGVPLAIELAAARVRVLAPDQLLRRLERPLEVLGTAAQDVPARQRTLRQTIAWSHDLLAPAERLLFRRLGIFAGGWTLPGAEAVTSLDGDPRHETLGADGTLEALAGLIDHSLVQSRTAEPLANPSPASEREPRYTMLETIREFAAELLSASGDADAVRRARDEHLMRLVEEAERGLRGPRHVIWLDRLDDEHANLRAALGRALERGDGETALGLAPRLWEFWRIRGYAVEGHAWLKRTRALAATADPAQVAAVDYALGKLSIDLGDYDAADRCFLASAALWQKLDNDVRFVEATNARAIVKLNVGALDDARTLGEDALRLALAGGDERGIATALLNLGMIEREAGQLPRAAELLGESLAVWRKLDDPAFIALATINLGTVHRLSGDTVKAHALFGESDALYARIGDRFSLAVIAQNRGHLARLECDAERANTLYADAMRLFDAVGSAEGVIESIEWIAVTLGSRGETDAALHLLGAAAAARQALRLPPLALDARTIDEARDAAWEAAGETTAAAAQAAGAVMPLDQARELALIHATAATATTGAERP
jgi:predicted ATPase/DNA-binding SARP family transcriptional activator